MLDPKGLAAAKEVRGFSTTEEIIRAYLEATGEAKPVAWMDDGTLRAGSEKTAHRVVTAEQKRDMPAAVRNSFNVPLYTAPLPAPSADGGRVAMLEAEVKRLNSLINSPETDDWIAGVPLEAAHQIERWGADHDAGKSSWDWFWLIGYLAQKAASAQANGDLVKAKHHTISTAAALLNWHRHLSGENTRMRPGIDPIERNIA